MVTQGSARFLNGLIREILIIPDERVHGKSARGYLRMAELVRPRERPRHRGTDMRHCVTRTWADVVIRKSATHPDGVLQIKGIKHRGAAMEGGVCAGVGIETSPPILIQSQRQ